MKYQAVTQAVLNIGCDFQNLQPYHFEPEKQKTAFNVVTFLIKWEKKANPSLYKIVLETLGGETREIDCLCCKILC